ncbi:hypothetical protein TNCV_309001 [Trichonephila clavipes]|nr:hypothetical protein TNCV_309001 [Trichonephila clavipes]
MLIQPASSQPVLMRGTVVLLENSITVRITEQHKGIEVIPHVPNCLQEVLYIPVSACPGKTRSPMVSIEQWHSCRSTAPEIDTVHTPFTDCTTGTVIQLDELMLGFAGCVQYA